MFVKPKNNLLVRDLILMDFLPVEGREVAPSAWWDRRLAEDAIEIVPPAQAAKPVKTNAKGDSQ